MPYLGEVLALLTAVVWAFAVILFKKSGESVHPIFLNLFKNTLAVILFLPTMLIFGETLLREAPTGEYVLLLFSGMMGIGLGDVLFFSSLNRIGAGLSAIVGCMYSPFIISLSILFLGERLTGLQVVGALLIISAVLSTTQRRKAGRVAGKRLAWGIFLGVVSTAATAAGIVMIKPLLERSPLLWVTEVRLLGGILFLIVVSLLHPSRRKVFLSPVSTRGWTYTVTASFFGAYLAMVLWLAGMKFAQASVAAALNQTSNIFVFVFATVLLHEALTLRRAIAIGLAMSGASLVFFGS